MVPQFQATPAAPSAMEPHVSSVSLLLPPPRSFLLNLYFTIHTEVHLTVHKFSWQKASEMSTEEFWGSGEKKVEDLFQIEGSRKTSWKKLHLN